MDTTASVNHLFDEEELEDDSELSEEYLSDFRDGSSDDSESMEPCYFSRIPDELTARIFSCLHPVHDRLPLLGCVCSKWRKILKETSRLWRKIHIHSDGYKTYDYQVLATIFRVYGSQIQQLTWQSGSRVYESVFNLIPRLTSLTILRLPILWNHWVVETLAPLSKLEEVQINGGFELTDRDLLTAAVNFQSLRRVTLNSCWSVTDRGVESFLSSLPRLVDCKLKINVGLPLADVRSDHAMLQGSMIARTVAESTRAESITMLSLNFVPIEMEELWGVVNSLTRLRKLCISNCEVGQHHGTNYAWGVISGNVRFVTNMPFYSEYLVACFSVSKLRMVALNLIHLVDIIGINIVKIRLMLFTEDSRV